RGIVRAADDRVQVVDAAVGRSVRIADEAHLADGAELGDERWDAIGRAFAVRDQIEGRILRTALLVRPVLRIRDQETAGSARTGLAVTDEAGVGVKSSAQAGGVGLGGQEGFLRSALGKIVATFAGRLDFFEADFRGVK